MTQIIYGGKPGQIGSEASILLNGAGRQVTLPKGIRMRLREAGWKDGRVLIIFDDNKNTLTIVPTFEIQEKHEKKLEKIMEKNAAGLICTDEVIRPLHDDEAAVLEVSA